MKKILTVALTLMLALCALLGLTACGDKDTVTGIEGTYKFYLLQAGNNVYHVGDDYYGTIPEDYDTVTINKDGTYSERTVDVSMSEPTINEYTGTWELKEGHTYTFKILTLNGEDRSSENLTTTAEIVNGVYMTYELDFFRVLVRA